MHKNINIIINNYLGHHSLVAVTATAKNMATK